MATAQAAGFSARAKRFSPISALSGSFRLRARRAVLPKTLLAALALLAPIAVAFVVLGAPSPAAATGVGGWCTVVGPGSEECGYSGPHAACERQRQVYAPDQTLLEEKDSIVWWRKKCSWTRDPTTIYATYTDFKCSSGIAVPGGTCLTNPFSWRPGMCQRANTTDHPIDVTIGAKRFSEVDYETATGLRLRRVYASNLGDSHIGLQYQAIGMANWLYDFQVELQLGGNWPTQPYILVAIPGAGTFDFERASNGTMVPYMGAGEAPQREYRLSFVGSWPGSLSTLKTTSSQFLFRDCEDNSWELTTFPNHVDGEYTIGRPTKLTDRLGRVTTFQYDTAGKLSSMEDAYGNSISFTWMTTEHPMLAEAALPGGEKFTYSYYDQIRLVDVKRYDASDVLLDQRSFAYGNADYPTHVTEILDRDNVSRWSAAYDSYGRATSSSGPGGVDATTVSYPSSTTRVVTNVFGQQTTYTYASDTWSARLTGVSAAATTNVPAMSKSVGYTSEVMSSETDFEGRSTQYSLDNPRGLPTQIVAAAGTPQSRTIGIQWDSHVRAPALVTTPTLKTEVDYVAASGGGEDPPPPPTTTAHRHWRIRIIDASGENSTNYYASMATLQMFEGAGAGDVASSAAAIGSSSATAANANDADLATNWSPVNGADPPPFGNMYWRADFGSGTTRLIKAIAITASLTDPGAAPVEFRVEWSDDALTWSEQWRVTGQLNWREGETRLFTDPGYTYTGSFWGAHAYWRLLATERTSGTSGVFSAAELQYRATPGGSNQATGGTPAASSQYTSSYPASKAHDGSLSTKWVSQSGSTAWIQYHFTSAVSLSEVRWTARNDGYPQESPVAGVVLYSDNGTTWRAAYTLKKATAWTNGEAFNFTDPAYVP